MTAPHSPGPESGRDFSAAGSGSDLARAAEEQAVEQALALVGGGGWDPGRDQAGDPGRDPARDPGRDPGRDPSRDLGKDLGSDLGRDLGTEPSRGMSDGPGSGSRGGLGNGPSGSISGSTGGSTADDPHTNSNGSPSDGTLGPGPRAPELHAPPLPWERARAVAARAGRGGPGAVIRLPLDRALGHVLAEALGALTDLPSFDTSAMDGWAVAGPGPWAYESGAGLLAGRREPSALSDGNAVRIATGARVPPDTTAVIRSEHAHADEAKGLLHGRRPVVTGQDIRPRGQECRSGEQLVPAGTVVTPAVLGLAAAAGYDALPVVPRPRVDILVLGDELLAAGLPHDGLIRDALGPMLGPWLRALGAEVSGPVRLGDDAGALREAIIASDADVIVTTGGTAAGPVDHVHVVLDGLGAELLVDGVAVRPGHPMLLARLPASGQPDGTYSRQDGPYTRQDGTCSQQDGPHPYLRPDGPYLVGLPGNPLAAVSGLLTLAEPLLAGIAGRPDQDAYRALVHAEVPGHPRDTRLVPVVHRAGGAGGRDHVAPLRYNGPAMLRGIAAADGLAVVPPGGVRSGTEVEILDLPWAPATPWTEGCFT
ncbi:molybdopterin molybdotransferase MoeA [Streptomyces sp. C11-1]|uniref:Molybdopterin molybdenumtransferase n=1 Tax=Streptomyces durocortorensis TaxID=2811104 RepID=A0ABY9VZT2_9ACTN|nr:molybdopterin molybdotransferase MoeA [Streptomyces durocortorensis]WNF28296.1 molybdopterin molybdotransferase MoeA [Streptomyces durocortorensis]